MIKPVSLRTVQAITGKLGRTGVIVAVAAVAAAAATLSIPLYKVYSNDVGTLQSATADTTLTSKNKFFDPSLGTNGQSCATCHQPDQSFSLHLSRIQSAFNATGGLDPIFRPNDTADRPDADVSTLAARQQAYNLVRTLGVMRIGKAIPGNADYIATLNGATTSPAYSQQFGYLPNNNDPQAPVGTLTLSLFRRPLVNTNVRFDSAVLWDGRASIFNMPGQVNGAAKTLLLAGGEHSTTNISSADAQQVANFMLGVFTDQVGDNLAGNLAAKGATGGVNNLLALSQDPTAPCTPLIQAANPSTCTPVDLINGPGTTMFSAWLNLPDDGTPDNERRLSIARGEVVFNTAVLTMPADLKIAVLPPGTTQINCKTCHANPNLGNNPLAGFLGRLGTDSIAIMQGIAAARPDLQPSINNMITRLQMLPEYCLRSNLGPALSSASPCGSYAGDPTATPPIPGDFITTDPGKAGATGLIADAGRFKPPTLRALAGRGPYFHQGMAPTLDDLINFYDGRFSIHLTAQQHADLKAFLEAY